MTAARMSVAVTTTAAVRVRPRLPLAIASVAVVAVLVGVSGVLDGSGLRAWDGAARVTAGAVTAVVCVVTGRLLVGPARRWRLLMGVGAAGWALGQLLSWSDDVAAPVRPAVVSLGDVGLLALPVCALLALLAVAGGLPRSAALSPPRDRIELVLDSVLVTGSLLALAWSTLLGEVARVGALHPVRMTAMLALPVADLVLVIMILLLLTTRPAARSVRRPLLLAGAGLLAVSVSDGFRVARLMATELSGGAADLAVGGPLASASNAGYVGGLALLALAALCPPTDPDRLAGERADADWLHLLLPYVPVIATGVMIAIRTGTGGRLTPFEAYLGWAGLGLVVARQMFTIVDNTVLLARVSEGRQRLQHQAYHDPLTGLANRALFRERLVLALDGHRHHGRPMALLFADLDDFKAVNDGFGHAMGDRLLQVVGERLAGSVRRGDTVARLGGDEFAVLLERRPAEAESVGRRIMAALREPFLVNGHPLSVSASVGLVVPESTDGSLTADALLRRADAAMYAGKRRGKGALVRYAGDGGTAVGDTAVGGTAVGDTAVGDVDLPHRLSQALGGSPSDAGFAVHYQPIVRLSDGETVAVEALARWTDPIAGQVDPEVFVTIAERTGMVDALDDFVLDRACADATALAVVYGRDVDVHVNVSAARLGRHGLPDVVGEALRRHGLPATRLVVEITETSRISDLARAAAVVSRLRDAGVRVALDDFGSGFHALPQLHALPVDIVKLDATLTDVERSPHRSGAICRSVLAICAELGIVVVAEGVESTARAEALSRLGCPLGQGYLFGPAEPVPPPDDRVVPRQRQHPPTSAHLAS